MTFEGTAFDHYGCPIQCSSDIQDIYFHIQRPDFDVTTSAWTGGISVGQDWSWTWDFSALPREIATYTFTVWASDTDFCQGSRVPRASCGPNPSWGQLFHGGYGHGRNHGISGIRA